MPVRGGPSVWALPPRHDPTPLSHLPGGLIYLLNLEGVLLWCEVPLAKGFGGLATCCPSCL